MHKKEIVLATANKGKIAEMASVLASYGFIVYGLDHFNIQLPEETGLTFVENAILKARHASKITNLPAIADDSGLVVAKLQGAPGLYSARYAGVDGDSVANRQKLLTELANVPISERQAKFVCCISLIRYAIDPIPVIAYAECSGLITTEERGDNGFGYDPLFLVPDLNLTFAEISTEQKQQISHRGKALNILKQQLNNL